MVSAMGPHDQSWITGNTGVNLRGVTGGTLVMIDGIPVNWNGVSHLDMIPVGAVEKVEVVKGGGAVLYGSSAYGGVINVITRKDGQGSVRLGAGSDGQRVGSVAAGNNKLRVFYSYDRMGDQGIMTAVPSSSMKTVNGKKYKYDTGFGESKNRRWGFPIDSLMLCQQVTCIQKRNTPSNTMPIVHRKWAKSSILTIRIKRTS